MTTPFTKKTLAFLRSLARHNDRDWFRAHKEEYERHVRGPMIEVLARLAVDFRRFAPELIADPKVSLFRIHRDTRFSADKSPLKTHIGAHFPTRGFPRGQGAGLYFEIAPQWVWIGGGLYMPSTPELQAIREHIASTHPRLHRLVSNARFVRVLGDLHGERLTRTPRGHAADHPAAHYLQFKQFLVGREFDVPMATSRTFYPQLLTIFKAAMPLVRFLNDAIQGRTGAISTSNVTVDQPAPVALARLPEPMW